MLTSSKGRARGLGLVMAAVVALTLHTPGVGVAKAPTTSTASWADRAGRLLRGTLWRGPKHTVHGATQRPKLLLGSMAAVAALGVIANQTGIPTDLAVAAGSMGALGFQLRQGLRTVKAAQGMRRWQLVGAELVWPTLLWGATTVAGFYVGHGGEELSNLQAAMRSLLLGGDGPAMLVMALDPAPDDGSDE